jgi:hypothetical protein
MVACEEHDCERRKPARARGMTASIGLSHVDGERPRTSANVRGQGGGHYRAAAGPVNWTKVKG